MDKLAAIAVAVALLAVTIHLDFFHAMAGRGGGPVWFIIIGLIIILRRPRPVGPEDEVVSPLMGFMGWFILLLGGGGAIALKAAGWLD